MAKPEAGRRSHSNHLGNDLIRGAAEAAPPIQQDNNNQIGKGPDSACAGRSQSAGQEFNVDEDYLEIAEAMAPAGEGIIVDPFIPDYACDEPDYLREIAEFEVEDAKSPEAKATSAVSVNADNELSERAAIILSDLGQAPWGIDTDDPAQVIAYSAGLSAAEEGRSRQAVPPEYREESRSAEAAAWRAGYDYVQSTIAPF